MISAKRIAAVLLAALMLVPMLASCSETGKTPDTTAADTTAAVADTQTEEVTTADPTRLEEKNLGGWEFNALVRGAAENSYWKCVDILVEDYTGDVLNDSVLERNGIIQDKYNVKITQVETGNQSLVEARNYISAGEDSFAAFCLRTDYTASLSTEGSLIDLFTVPYLQLEQPWWDQNAVKELSIAKKLYFTTGDLSISCADAVQIPVFNKTVLSLQEGMEDPYELVREGKWTMSKMLDMALAVNTDVDGDGAMGEKDKWGYLAYGWGALFLFFGSGETIVAKDENDLPYLSVYNDRSVNVMDLVYKINGGGNPDIISGYSALQTTMMSEDRVLFTITSMATVRKQFRENVESDIGILPVPKFDEEQPRYYNLVVFQDTSNMYSVPKTSSNVDNTGFVLEALAQESTDTLREAYYDKTISYKALRDKDSLDMLKIILETRTYDLSSAYLWGAWNGYFTGLTSANGKNQFSSYYAKLSKPTEKAINTTVEKLTGLDG